MEVLKECDFSSEEIVGLKSGSKRKTKTPQIVKVYTGIKFYLTSKMDNPALDFDDELKTDANNTHSSDNGKVCDTLTLENPVLKSEDSRKTPPPQKSKVAPDNSRNFEINVYKNHKISICKPLIPLKLTLFLYYGAGSFMTSFVAVLYKQRGVSLSELSMMTISAPAFQFLGTTLSGVTADKIGRAKPVFIANLLLTIIVVFCILMLPKIQKINSTDTETQFINLTCYGNEVEAFTSCGAMKKTIEVESCVGYCQDTLKEQCSWKQIDCGNFDYSKELNMSFTVYLNDTFMPTSNDSCRYNATSDLKGNSSYSWCSKDIEEYCTLSCTGYAEVEIVGSDWILVAYFIFYVVFLTTFSNCYRCLDVTCMFLVKEYDSTFGHERFFAMLGNVLVSPVAGLIADATTPPGAERNFSSALYLSIGMNIFLLPILYKLDVRIKPPGEKMWKKSLTLLRNPDVLSFFILILVVGTAWNFSKLFMFWYLDELNASSVLVGLLTSVSALYGLPFLLTSHWWVKKIGTTRIFILALLAYSVNSMGYSFLRNPWYSLLLESTGIVSYYIFWVAVMEHSHDIAPEGLRATIISVSGALHFSIGKVSSGLMAKFIMNRFGGITAFRFSAAMTLIAAFIFIFYLFLRKKCFKTKHRFNSTGELSQKTKEMEGISTVTMKDLK